MLRLPVLMIPLFVLYVSSICHSDDWPQFQGLHRNGVSTENNLSKKWPKDGPPVLWTVPLGPGFAGQSIRDGRVYVLDREDDQRDVLRCFDLLQGTELWRSGYDAPGRLSYNGSRSTATIDEQRAYTVGPFGDVYCFDLTTHQPLWNKSLLKDFHGASPNWGFSQSPLLHGEKIIVAPLGQGPGLVALNRKTGELVWKTPSIGGESYTSPMVATLNGVEQILMLTRGHLTSVDPQTGLILWKYDGYYNKIPIPNPTPIGQGKLYISGGYSAGSVVIQVSREGNTWSVKETQRIPGDGSQIQPVILYKGYLYANLNTNENLRRNPRGLSCFDLDGNILWKSQRNPALNRGSILLAGELILAMGGQDGILHLIEANPKKLNLLSSAAIFKNLKKRDNNIWSPMALSNGKLVVRCQNEMKCLELIIPKPI